MSESDVNLDAVLVGTSSDQVPAILATGTGEIAAVYLSLSARHAEGRDAEYLAWHTLDHRPEQLRLKEIKASLRLVSTPACRAARAAAEPPFDAVDHVMSYFFTDLAGLRGFDDLAVALRDAGRMTHSLPSVQPGLYAVEERVAHPRLKAGADVLPWWPLKGAYLLIERGPSLPLAPLLQVEGVAGAWGMAARESPYSRALPDQRAALLFLDDEPEAIAERLKPVLAERWAALGVTPLLAAPFHPIVPHEWHKYLP